MALGPKYIVFALPAHLPIDQRSLKKQCQQRLGNRAWILELSSIEKAREQIAARCPSVLVTSCCWLELVSEMHEKWGSAAGVVLISGGILGAKGDFFSRHLPVLGVRHVTAINPGSDFYITDLSITLDKLLIRDVDAGVPPSGHQEDKHKGSPEWSSSTGCNNEETPTQLRCSGGLKVVPEGGQEEKPGEASLWDSSFWGIRAYLGEASSGKYRWAWLGGSSDKFKVTHQIRCDALAWKLGSRRSDHIYASAEEMATNAIYDAPLAGQHSQLYQGISKSRPFDLRCEHWVRCEWGCNGDIFAVGVRDYWGGLSHSCVVEHLQKIQYAGQASQLLEYKPGGGAGLGFFKIFLSSHALIVQVREGQCTEVIALYDLKAHKAPEAPSRGWHYFSLKSVGEAGEVKDDDL